MLRLNFHIAVFILGWEINIHNLGNYQPVSAILEKSNMQHIAMFLFCSFLHISSMRFTELLLIEGTAVCKRVPSGAYDWVRDYVTLHVQCKMGRFGVGLRYWFHAYAYVEKILS